jgi:hypothetical protein
MTDDASRFKPVAPEDLAYSISFALRFSGKKRFHNGDQLVADITADHIVRYLDRCGYVLMKRPTMGGSAPLNPPKSWPYTTPEDMKKDGR